MKIMSSLKGHSKKLLPVLLAPLLLSACNDNQPAQKLDSDNEPTLTVNSAQSNSSATTQTPELWLTVKAQEYGDSGVVLNLHAGLTDNSRPVVSSWRQVSGPEVVVINPGKLQAAVVLPWVEQPTSMGFEITATSNGETIVARQTLVALPLTSRAEVINPVVTAENNIVTVNLSTPIAANSILDVSVGEGTATEGDDFAILPTTVTTIDGTLIELPIQILPSSQPEDVYTKIILRLPNGGDPVVVTVVIPASVAEEVAAAASSALALSSAAAVSSSTITPSSVATSSDGGFNTPSSVTAASSSEGGFNAPSSVSPPSSTAASSSVNTVSSSEASSVAASSTTGVSSSEAISSSSEGIEPPSDDIDFSLFTDPALRACVEATEYTQISKLDFLFCSSLGIADASGVEQLTALLYLDLAGNQLSSIDVSKNTALLNLNIGANRLTSVDISMNQVLENFDFYENSIGLIDLSKNILLYDVDGNNNELAEIQLPASSELVSLALDGNQLVEIDLSMSTNLRRLALDDNKLNIVDVSANTALHTLSVINNNLSILDVSENIKLSDLYLAGNQIPCAEIQDLIVKFGLIAGRDCLHSTAPDNFTFNSQTEVEPNTPVSSNPIAVTGITTRVLISIIDGEYSLDGGETFTAEPGMVAPNAEVMVRVMSAAVVDETTQATLDVGGVVGTFSVTTRSVSDDIDFSLFIDPALRACVEATGETKISELVYLNCIHLDISDSVGIEQLTELTELHLAYNNLTEIDVTENIALLSLFVGFNNLSTIDVSHNMLLTELWVGNNILVSIDLSNNSRLRDINARDNDLSFIDVSANIVLERLDLRSNQLTGIDVSVNTELTSLYLKDNLIPCDEVKDIAGTLGLAIGLDCIADTVPDSFTFSLQKEVELNSLIISKLITVRSVDVPVPISIVGGEYSLDGGETYTDEVGMVAPNAEVIVRVMSSQTVSTTTEATLDIGGVTGTFGVTTLSDDIDFSKFTDPALRACVEATGGAKISGLTDLNCGSLDISNASGIEQLTSLTSLNLSNNDLTEFDVSANVELTDLWFSGNALTSIDLSANTKLTYLSAGSNNLNAIDLSSNVALKDLHLERSGLADIDLSKNVALTFLGLESNDLVALDISDNTALSVAYLGGNQLSTIDVSENVGLTGLYLNGNQLTSIDVSTNTALTSLGIAYNDLTAIDVSENAELNSLYIKFNHIPCSEIQDLIARFELVPGSDCLHSVVPDNFTFNPQAEVEPNTPISSNTIAITGITTRVPISILGGEYSLDNGETFTAEPGMVAPNTEVIVRLISAAVVNETTQTTLDVGGVTGVFSVTTRSAVISSSSASVAVSSSEESSSSLVVEGSSSVAVSSVESSSTSSSVSSQSSSSISADEDWGPMLEGLNSGTLGSIEDIATDGNGVWVAVMQGGYAARSTDDGVTWSTLVKGLNSGSNSGPNAEVITSVATDGNGVWVAVLYGGFASRSTDNGATWLPLVKGLNSGSSNRSILSVSTDGKGVWVTVGSGGYAARSTDNGETWSPLAQGLNSGVISPGWEVVATDASGVWIAGGVGGYAARSTDNGATWSGLPRWLNSGTADNEFRIKSLATDHNGVWVAVLWGGFAARSADNGVTWSPLPQWLGVGVGSLYAVETDGLGKWLAVGGRLATQANATAVAQSTDNGVTWSALPYDLNTDAIVAITWGSIATDNKGLWMVGSGRGYAARSPAIGSLSNSSMSSEVSVSSVSSINDEVSSSSEINGSSVRSESSSSSEISSSSSVESSSIASSSSQAPLVDFNLSLELESFDISSAYAQFILQHADGAIIDELTFTVNNVAHETNYASLLDGNRLSLGVYVDRNSVNTVTFDAVNSFGQSGSITSRFFLGTQSDDSFTADAELNVFVGYEGSDIFSGNDQQNVFYYEQDHGAITIQADANAIQNILHLGFSFSSQNLMFYRLGDDLLIEGETAGSQITLVDIFALDDAPVVEIRLSGGELLDIASQNIITMPTPPLLFLALTPDMVSVDSAGNVVLAVSVMEGDRPIVSLTENLNNDPVDILEQLDEGLYRLVFSPENLVGENLYTFTVTDDFGQQTTATALLSAGTDEADTLNATAQQNAVYGSAGNDSISASGANSLINGGPGNDTLTSNTGITTFVVNVGEGNDTIYGNRETDILVVNVPREAVRIFRLTNSETNKATLQIILSDADGESNSVYLINQLGDAGSYTGVSRIVFSEGEDMLPAEMRLLALTGTAASENLNDYATDDTLIGLAGNDNLYATQGDDRLEGGLGNDNLYGGAGINTYVVNVGEGNDTIYGNRETDILVVNVPREAIRIFRLTNSETNKATLQIILSDADGESNSVYLINQLGDAGSYTGVSRIVFSEGEDMLPAEMRLLALTGTAASENLNDYATDDTLIGLAGNDNLSATQGDDRLEGGLGNDTLYGGAGINTYVVNVGEGNDTIYGSRETDILVLNVPSSSVTIQRVTSGSGENIQLIINDGVSNSIVTLVGQLSVDGATYTGVSRVVFSDEIIWTAADLGVNALACQGVFQTINGTPEADEFLGQYFDEAINGAGGDDLLNGAGGCDVLDGGPGDDVLDGGAGDDQLHGAIGHDRILFGYGSGHDTVVQWDGSNDDTYLDALVFGEDVSISVLRLEKIGSDLLIILGQGEDSLRFIDWFKGLAYQIDQLQFSGDQPVMTREDFLAQVPVHHVGTDGDDILVALTGLNYLDGFDGNDDITVVEGDSRINGGTGDDTLIGGAGFDTFVFSVNDGVDIVYAQRQQDVLQFVSITAEQVQVVRSQNGNTNDVDVVVLSDGVRFSQITLVNQLGNVGAGIDYSGVREVIFADGTGWSDADIQLRVFEGEIDFSLFNDEALQACVRATDVTRVAELTQLNCSEAGIFDLGGIKQLTALASLNLSGNQLTSVDLSQNTALIDLDLAQNQLTSIDVSSNVSLAYLSLDGNQLEGVDIAENTKLTDLFIAGNGINCFEIQHLISQFETVNPSDCINVPGDFVFEPTTDAELNSLVASNVVTISGIISAVPISITGGEYSLDGGESYTAEAGVVEPQAEVVVRAIASQGFDETTQTLLNVGGVVGRFSVTTRSAEKCENLVPALLGELDSRAVSVSGIYSDNYPGWLAFDGERSSLWISEVGQSPAWIAYGFQQPTAVTQYSIDFANGSLTSRAPKNFSLQGSSGGGWITLDTQENQEEWAGSEKRVYTLEQPAYFRQYRIYVTDDNHPDEGIVVISIAELMLENCGELPAFDVSGSSVPNEFGVVAKTEVEPNSLISSSAITVSGFSTRTSVSIVGGEYSLDGGQTFTAAAGFVEPQVTVIVRAESSPLLAGTTEATLEVGGVKSTFSVTTRAVSDEIDFGLFSDAALYDCVKATGVTEISRLRSLTCEDAGIIDASGIGQLTALTSLNLRDNQLEFIDVSNNAALTTLLLNDNRLAEIDVSVNQNLGTLWLSNNLLTEIDIASSTKLTSLLLNGNSLESIDVSTNELLITLWLGRNQLTEIDLSKNTVLDGLLVNENNLMELDVSNNAVLTNLNVRSNSLSSIDPSFNTMLTHLNVDLNELTAIDASMNPALTSLNLSGNALTELDVSKNKNLTSLRVPNNQLTQIDVSNNTALTQLSLDQNQLSVVDVTMNAELTHLSLTSNRLSAINTLFNPVLTSLSLSGNPLSTVDVSMNAELTSLVLQNCQLKEIDVSQNFALERLNLRYNQLTDIDVSMNANLEMLNLLGNETSCEYFREITSPYLKEGVLDCPIAN